MKTSYKVAFTLVELIVVIVILAILATISFLSFSSYSLKSRDSVRLADMNNISKGLLLYYTKSGTYPIPDNSITITASGTNIGYQGYAGLKTLGIINLSNGGKDPLDNIYYTYNTNTNQNKYQLLGYLEDSTSISFNTNIYNSIYADSSDYSKRFYYTKGDSLGVIVNSGTNTPIQYNNTNSGFELTAATGTNYSVYIDKSTTIQSTGSMIGGLAGFYTVTQANSRYPGCDTNDIKLSNGQIWAACNVGATQAFNGINPPIACTNSTGCTSDPYPTMRNTLGSYFQWGRNEDVTLTTSTGILSSSQNVGHNYFIFSTIGSNYDWISTSNPNLWGGSGTTSTGGTYYTQGQPSSMKGPCHSGYHIPTTKEWCDAELTVNPSLSCVNTFLNDVSFASVLKLPLAGGRRRDTGNYINQGYNTSYWSSSNGTNRSSYHISISYRQLFIQNANPRAFGFVVRCIKN